MTVGEKCGGVCTYSNMYMHVSVRIHSQLLRADGASKRSGKDSIMTVGDSVAVYAYTTIRIFMFVFVYTVGF